MTVADHLNQVRLGHPLGNRVAIFGAGGKSTLAAAIARKSGLTHLNMDEIRGLPGWRERPQDETLRIINEGMTSDPAGWVTDHQYRPAMELIMAQAESVIVLALPFRTMFWRRFKRSVKRAWTGQLVVGGSRETFRQHFASRDSAILELWQRRHRYRRIDETISAQAREGVDFFCIRSGGELDRFYEVQGLTRDR